MAYTEEISHFVRKVSTVNLLGAEGDVKKVSLYRHRNDSDFDSDLEISSQVPGVEINLHASTTSAFSLSSSPGAAIKKPPAV